ncbi:MAG: hypothetical protein H6523_12870 [Mycolicibacterium sp.]|nr:hypothetical protein [Mycolicibacterium sp.]
MTADPTSGPVLTAELMPLFGSVLVGKKPKPKREGGDDERDAITEAVDATPWLDWLAGDPRLVDTGTVDECGCQIAHWHTSGNQKSATLHVKAACGKGLGGIHIWSGTMRADLGGIDEHLSPLTFASKLHGVSECEAAAAVGIALGGRGEVEYDAELTPEAIDARASTLESEGDPARAERRREVAEVMRSNIAKHIAPAPPATFRVSGGPTPAPVINVAGSDGSGEGAVTEGDDADSGNDNALDELFAELADPYAPELEAAVFEFLPQLRAIREAARRGAVSPWSVLGITIGRGLLRVSPSVTIPPLLAGKGPAPLNLQIGIVGRSGKGKGLAAKVVDYDTSVNHGWDAKFKPPSGAALANLFVAKVKGDDGEFKIEQVREAAWCDWTEVDTLTATAKRGGNDLAGELRAAISGEELGTDPKGEGQLPLKVAAMVYRILVSFSTQYGEPAAALMAERDGGTLQRTLWFGTADPRRLTKRPRGAQAWAQLEIMQQLGPEHTLGNGQQPLTVDEEIWDEVWEAQSASIDSDTAGDELGGHGYLNRLKVAAWAALIQHRSHIGAPDWDWAGAVMVHSDRIRDRVDASVRNLKVKQAREFGGLDHERRSGAGAAAAAERDRGIASLAGWAADPGKGPKHKRETGLFTASDIILSVKSGQPRRLHGHEWAAELVETGRWGSDGKKFWVL